MNGKNKLLTKLNLIKQHPTPSISPPQPQKIKIQIYINNWDCNCMD